MMTDELSLTMCKTKIKIRWNSTKIVKVRKVRFGGFSLIEVSISLIIIGIISTIGISQLRLMHKIYASQKTQANIDFVIKALGVYCTSKALKLPFPSKINTDIGHQSEEMQNLFGLVPFKSLGIMEKFAKDGNGRWLLYKMNPNFGKTIFTAEDKTIGISDFNSDIPGDRVAFIIKVKNIKNEDEQTIWYSERTFVANYTNLTSKTLSTLQQAEPEKKVIFWQCYCVTMISSRMWWNW